MPRIAQPMSQETQGNWVISVPFGITTPMRKDSKNGHSRGRFVRPIPVDGNPGWCKYHVFRPYCKTPRGTAAVLILVGPAYQRHIPYGKVEALQVLESGGSRSIRI